MSVRIYEIGASMDSPQTISRAMRFYNLTVPWTISRIVLPIVAINAQAAAHTVKFTLSNGTNTLNSDVFEINDIGEVEWVLDSEFTVPENGTLIITATIAGCTMNAEFSGLYNIGGATTQSGGNYWMINLKLEISYEAVWLPHSDFQVSYFGTYKFLMTPKKNLTTKIGRFIQISTTFGYITLRRQGFIKDENGYPKNDGAWKFDSQNNGFPWKVGFETFRSRGDRVMVMIKRTDGEMQWVNASCVVFGENNLVSAYAKIIEEAD